uniref:Fibronectin-binding domain-containing protein n=1 Tax=Staphylothermus marinus TaxID=2280 RepID=A0A7C4H8E4_STAMA
MIKKSMDIIDINVITNIYCKILENCYIDNIYYAGFYWFLKINCRGERFFVKIEPGVRIHISRVEPISKSIDRLTAFMRKHLRNSRIIGFKKYDWERIILIDLFNRETIFHLITEIIPRGFIIITNADLKIIYANQFVEMRDRVIKKNIEYKPPPSLSTPPNIDENELIMKLNLGTDLIRGVVKGWGLPGYIAEEILYRSGLFDYKNKKVSEINRSDLRKLVESYREIVLEAIDSNKGYLVLHNSSMHLYTLYKPRVYIEFYEASFKEYSDVNELIDIYFTQYEKEKIAEIERSKLEYNISQLEKTIEKQKNTIDKYEAREREFRSIYEILVNNYSLVEEILKCVNRVREEKGWDSVLSDCQGVYNIDRNRGLIYILLGDTSIPIDIRLDVWRNILNYSIQANKYKSLVEKARIHLDSLVKKMNELKNQINVLTQTIHKSIRPRYWYEKYHWIITSSGLLAIGGKNADQNESIVKKYMSNRDLFIHADIHGAPVTILKTNSSSFSEEDIYEAGLITTCYSRGWKLGLGYLDVYWVYGEQVSKKAPSGEYLSKGSFMIYGKRNYFRVELKLGIGIEEICDPVYGIYQRIIIGKPENIVYKTIVYGIIVPGEMSVNEVGREMYNSFLEKLGVDKLSVDLDELISRIPGKSRIISVNKGSSKRITEC